MNSLPGICQVNWQEFTARVPKCRVALGIVDDLQLELSVVIIDFFCAEGAIIIHRQQVPSIYL